MSPRQIHVTSAGGGVVLHIGRNKPVFLTSNQADAMGLEMIRKADVARLVGRMAGSGRLARR